MPYIGQAPTQAAFVTDTFSGNGATTAFTMSVAPAGTTSVLVAVSGVLQDPSTYSVSGLTLTFSAAPPSGTGNISARYLGIPASGVATTAYRTVTEFTATANQKTFTPPSYTVGFINVYRNGVLLGSVDYTATNGTTVVLTTGATSGDLVTVESFLVSSVLNAIPATTGSVGSTYLAGGAVLAANMGANGTWAPTGTVIQVVTANLTGAVSFTTATFTDLGLTANITPKFSNSKILVMVTLMNVWKNNTNTYYGLQIQRNGTAIQVVQSALYTNSANERQDASNCFNISDLPNTTSAVTYKIQMRNEPAVGQIQVNGSNFGTSNITLMEIAG